MTTISQKFPDARVALQASRRSLHNWRDDHKTCEARQSSRITDLFPVGFHTGTFSLSRGRTGHAPLKFFLYVFRWVLWVCDNSSQVAQEPPTVRVPVVSDGHADLPVKAGLNSRISSTKEFQGPAFPSAPMKANPLRMNARWTLFQVCIRAILYDQPNAKGGQYLCGNVSCYLKMRYTTRYYFAVIIRLLPVGDSTRTVHICMFKTRRK
ncbi:hypothetical protein BC835DRAFT_439241 [Cytidiella melzeri]|nr:hypothetical protein BC835DRAFT_439241 [Cytidiella melzeri]